jgi:hypothetical protein
MGSARDGQLWTAIIRRLDTFEPIGDARDSLVGLDQIGHSA